jgi:hypothetical protein
MLFTCRSWAGSEPCAKEQKPFYIPQRQAPYTALLVQRMQFIPCDKRVQKKRKKAARTIKTILELPHWEEPKDDNERLLTLQYNFLVKGDQSAWLELWQLTENVAGRMLGNMCRKRKLAFTREEWEDKRAEAVMYLLRRYKTRPGYRIEADFPLHIWYAVKHVLDYKRKCDGLVDYVSGAELDAIIESQNEDL